MVDCVKRRLQVSINLKNVLSWALDFYAFKMPMCLICTLKPNTKSENGKQ